MVQHNKKGAIPLKNVIILISLLIIFLLIMSAVIYFFGLQPTEKITSEKTAASPEEKLFLIKEDYTAEAEELIQAFGRVSVEEKNRRLLRDRIIFNKIITAKKINESKFLQEIYQQHQQKVEEISTELGITSEQAQELIIIFGEQRRNYPTLPDKDAYEMVLIDFQDYEEKLDNQVELPSTFVNNPPAPDNQIALILPQKSEQSFHQILTEVSGTENTSLSLNQSTKQSIKQNIDTSVDFDPADLLKNIIYRSLNTTETDFERSFCVLGKKKEILLRADYLISTQKIINYSYDVIVYDSKGKIIPELSQKEKAKQTFKNYNYNTFFLSDKIRIPLSYKPDKYFIEYTIKDQNLQERRMERIILDCQRQLFITDFSFLKIKDDEEVNSQKENTFMINETIIFRFSVGGFRDNFNKETEQFNIIWTIKDEDGSIVTGPINELNSDLTIDREEFLNIGKALGPLNNLPNQIEPGYYILTLKVEDLLHQESTESENYFQII